MEKRECRHILYMVGIDFSLSGTTVTITDGHIISDKTGEEYFVEGIYFDVEVSNQTDVVYDIYITKNVNDYAYEVEKTYLNPGELPSYTGDNELFHTFSSLLVKTDGSVEGYYCDLVKQEKKGDNSIEKSPS